MQINHIIVWNDQKVSLEEGITRIQDRFQGAVRGQLLIDMDCYEMTLGREKQTIFQIRDL